jgi:peptidoglycan/xylan/chitin deacetylase (PgdA/CDA1 family)
MVHRVMPEESGISGTAPAHLRNCLAYLRKHHYPLIAIEDAVERILQGEAIPKNAVAFTIDDGFADQVTTGADIFREFDCPSTCFLVTGFVDGELWPWDYQLMHIARHARRQLIDIEIDGVRHSLQMGTTDTKELLLKFVRQFAARKPYETTQLIAQTAGVEIPATPPADMQPATWEMVRAAEKLGMRFGAHSVRHHILSRQDDATLREEMTRSAQRIRKECRNPSAVFCYPSGKCDEFDRRAMDIAKELGLSAALSAEAGYLEPATLRAYPNYRYAIPRLPLPKSMDEFKLHLSWAQYVRERLYDSPLKTLYR